MKNNSLLHQTERFFYQQIPIAHAMGVRVESYVGNQLILKAPLEINHNHLGTAFGGSLSAIATLTGYGLLWLELGDRSVHIVIRDSSIQYLHPVRKSIQAVGELPSVEKVATFKKQFHKTGKARLAIRVTMMEDDRVCVIFEGTYVAIR